MNRGSEKVFRVLDSPQDGLNHFRFQLVGQVVDVLIVEIKGCLVDAGQLGELPDCDFFQGLFGPELDKGIDNTGFGAADTGVHSAPSF